MSTANLVVKDSTQRPIPLLAPARRFQTHASLEDVLVDAAKRVIVSGRYILGEEVEALEARLKSLVGTSWALGVKSGTDALLLALEAFGIGPGAQVMLPAFSFFATASTVMRMGARPQLVDVCPGCLCLCPHHAKVALGPLTQAIIPVHLFGQSAAMGPLKKLAQKHQLVMIEDAAQATGSQTEQGAVGSLGDVGCFSLFPSKNLGAIGDGGFLTGNNSEVFESLLALRVHGSHTRYVHHALGGNFRLDALQAALIYALVGELDGALAKRQQLAAQYDALFRETDWVEDERCGCDQISAESYAASEAPLGLPVRRDPTLARGHTFNQYVIRLRTPGLRNHVLKSLEAQKIGCAIYYPQTLGRQPALGGLGIASDAHPHAERATQEVLALPIHPQLTEWEVERVTLCVKEAIERFFNV